MADMSTILKNTEFTLSFTLYKNDGSIVANPGTYTKKVSIDGGAVADIAASVTEEDATYGQLSLVLADAEMNGDWIWVYVTDNTAGTVPFTATLYPAAGALASAAALTVIDDFLDTEMAAVYAAVHTDAAGTNIAADIIAMKADTTATLEDTGTTLDTLVKDVPTVSELSTALGTADDATLAAIVALDAVVDTVKVDTAATLIDTNELQTNQGDWATATGFSTFDPATNDVAVVNLVDVCTTNSDMVAEAPNAAAINAACDTAISDAALGTATNLAAVKTVVDEIPTSAELATALGTADDATLAAIVALDTVIDTVHTDVDAILVDTGTTLPAAISGISAGSGLDAAGVRAAIGLAAANLDTQIAAIDGGGGGSTDLTGVTAALAALQAELDAVKEKTDTIDTVTVIYTGAADDDEDIVITAADATTIQTGVVNVNRDIPPAT